MVGPPLVLLLGSGALTGRSGGNPLVALKLVGMSACVLRRGFWLGLGRFWAKSLLRAVVPMVF